MEKVIDLNSLTDELKLIDIAKVNLKSAVILFASSNDNAIFVSGVTKNLTDKFNLFAHFFSNFYSCSCWL